MQTSGAGSDKTITSGDREAMAKFTMKELEMILATNPNGKDGKPFLTKEPKLRSTTTMPASPRGFT